MSPTLKALLFPCMRPRVDPRDPRKEIGLIGRLTDAELFDGSISYAPRQPVPQVLSNAWLTSARMSSGNMARHPMADTPWYPKAVSSYPGGRRM